MQWACVCAGLFILLGLAGGMDTLCGQAFGAGNLPFIGIVTQRAVLINIVAAIPIVLMWTNMSSILLWLGQEKEIAQMAANFLLLSVPQLFCSVVTVALEKFQTVQVTSIATSLSNCAEVCVRAIVSYHCGALAESCSSFV